MSSNNRKRNVIPLQSKTKPIKTQPIEAKLKNKYKELKNILELPTLKGKGE